MNRIRGFTFIELIIAITVVAILSAIAIPSYRSYVLRSNRSEAIANLTQMAMLLEQRRALHGTYCLSAACINGTAADTFVYTENDAGAESASNTMGPGKSYLSGFRPKQATTGRAVRYNYQAVVNNDTYDLTATGLPARNVRNTALALDELGAKTETPSGGTVEYGW